MEFSGLGAVEEPLLAWLPAHNNHSHPPVISTVHWKQCEFLEKGLIQKE
jgi:hypothetical protein